MRKIFAVAFSVRRSRLSALACVVAILGAAVGVTGAAASPPTPASGTFTTTSSSANFVRFDGGNLILDESGTIFYTGTFSGTSTFHGSLVIHTIDGSANFSDVETFTGTVNGVSGTVTLNLNGRNDSTGVVQATDTIVGATGDLAGLHGVLSEVGTVTGPPGPLGTYTGQIVSP